MEVFSWVDRSQVDLPGSEDGKIRHNVSFTIKKEKVTPLAQQERSNKGTLRVEKFLLMRSQRFYLIMNKYRSNGE